MFHIKVFSFKIRMYLFKIQLYLCKRQLYLFKRRLYLFKINGFVLTFDKYKLNTKVHPSLCSSTPLLASLDWCTWTWTWVYLNLSLWSSPPFQENFILSWETDAFNRFFLNIELLPFSCFRVSRAISCIRQKLAVSMVRNQHDDRKRALVMGKYKLLYQVTPDVHDLQ